MKIEIFGTGCPKCKKLFENTQKVFFENRGLIMLEITS